LRSFGRRISVHFGACAAGPLASVLHQRSMQRNISKQRRATSQAGRWMTCTCITSVHRTCAFAARSISMLCCFWPTRPGQIRRDEVASGRAVAGTMRASRAPAPQTRQNNTSTSPTVRQSPSDLSGERVICPVFLTGTDFRPDASASATFPHQTPSALVPTARCHQKAKRMISSAVVLSSTSPLPSSRTTQIRGENCSLSSHYSFSAENPPLGRIYSSHFFSHETELKNPKCGIPRW